MLSNPTAHALTVRVIHQYDDQVPTFYQTFPVGNRSTGEALKEEVPYWTPENPIFIDAPPGTGKTSFVYNVLLPRAIEKGGNILIVSNRIALSSQQKETILKILESPLRRLLTDEGIQKTEDFGVTRVLTYHRLPALLADQSAKSWLANLSYVVFDECHFFVADAIFNENCDFYLKLATRCFCQAIRIYMTATSWDILVPLAEAEQRNYRSPLFNPPIFYRTFYRYFFEPINQRYKLRFFDKLADLLPFIQEKPDEKWVVFVDQKEAGQQFSDNLGKLSTYLDSDGKGSTFWNELVKNEKFSSQVLVTTAVLDCGVNLIDAQLTNIVVVTDNRTSLIQMAGRKRFKGEEKINLWVCNLDQRVAAARAVRYRKWLTWYDQLERCTSSEAKMKIAQAIWSENDSSLFHLFRLGNGTLFSNRLAYYAIQRKLRTYSKILSGETTFQDLVSEWLGVESPSPQDQRAQLEAFYNTWGEQHLPPERQAELRRIICNLYASTGHKDPQPRRAETMKYSALSNRLAEMNLPFRIVNGQTGWILQSTIAQEENL